ncbi:MAG: xanthine dehydrogenase family protein molybdopterin-binding subunit, partial [Thermomicrobium sp.]|nr:xanthine dehydrogenase family protein molybdopterin-binding subunit [Thermomicrobium sp.]
MIGQSVNRVEDFRFLTGQACYTRDVQIPGTAPLQALFLRSPYPAARITRILTEQAARVPGVVAVLTAAALPRHLRPIPLIRKPPTSHHALPVIPLLADQVVRYQGEPIACVVATTEAVAQDALELIQVEYEPLPAIGQIDAAIGS